MYVSQRLFLGLYYQFNFRYTGILCYTLDTFVGVNEQGKIILYNLERGIRWALPELNKVVSVSPIHRNTEFVVGGPEAQPVDIPRALITQVLRQGLNTEM